MSNLLDTHTFIWFINGDKQLSNNARNKIESSPDNNFISIASIWEMAIKISLGKLELKTSFEEIYKLIENNNFQILPITFDDTLTVSSLPLHHRDPFDRLIIAQAINRNMHIITKDENFDLYNVETIW